MKTISLFFLINFSLNVNLLFAQDDPLQVNVIPASPTTAAFNRYGEIPVTLNSGTPNITIPIYNAKGKELEVPITLSYHASGIKVCDAGSWVGLGWSLNAGGVIGKTIVGISDDIGFDCETLYGSAWCEAAKNGTYNNTNDLGNLNKMKAMADNIIDSQPDIHFFNFFGQSGKFLIADNSFPTIPYSPLKIERKPSGVGDTEYEWKITTTNGQKYFFGSVAANGQGNERVYSDPGTKSDFYPTAWYLRKIENVNATEEIEFIYTGGIERVQREAYGQLNWYNSVANTFAITDGDNTGYPIKNIFEYTGSRILSEIKTKSTIVKFYADIDRNDVYSGGKLLRRIEIIDRNSSPLEIIKAYNFTYDNNSNRVFLTHFEEEGKPSHQFDYYSGLPGRFSKSQDHWGYYNGKSNSNLISKDYSQDFRSRDNTTLLFPDASFFADREPDPSLAHFGSIKTITYPTGGRTEFEFESHRYNRSQFYFEEDIVVTNRPGVVIETSAAGTTDSELITIDIQQTIELNITFSNYLVGPPDVSLNPIIKVENNATSQVLFKWEGHDVPKKDLIQESPGIYRYSMGQVIQLSPGTYKFTAELGCQDICNQPDKPKAKVDFSYIKTWNYPVEDRGASAGGIRIMKISSYDDSGLTPSLIKNYKYQDTASFSSGHLKSKPRYIYDYLKDLSAINGKDCPEPPSSYFTATAGDHAAFGLMNGHIGYTRVVEYLGSGQIGKKEYQYTYFEPLGVIEHPFVPKESYDYKNGLLEKEISYDNNGLIIAENENTYHYAIENRFAEDAFRVGYYTKYEDEYPNCVYQYNVPNPTFVVSEYSIKSEWFYLKTTSQRLFDNNGQVVETITNNTYDPLSTQILSSKTTNSDNLLAETQYKYASNYGSPSDAIRQMINSKYMTGVPIEITKYVDGKAVSAQANRYVYDGAKDQILLKDVYLYEPNPGITYSMSTDGDTFPNYKKRLTYDTYDDHGNIQEYSKQDDYSSSIVWSYDNTLPIAKIDNVTITELKNAVANISSTFLSDLGNSKSQSYIDLKLEQLRTEVSNDLPNSIITTYTYDPLIGMTSQTDPAGITTYYEYDDFGRLQYVKDADGNVLSKNEYHYKTPNSPANNSN